VLCGHGRYDRDTRALGQCQSPVDRLVAGNSYWILGIKELPTPLLMRLLGIMHFARSSSSTSSRDDWQPAINLTECLGDWTD